MKTLLLIRHGKSSWDNPGLNDAGRPLNSRGKRNAPFMGALLRDKYGIIPDIIVTSSAVRARTTAGLLASELKYPPEKIQVTDQLYSVSVSELIKTIQSISGKNSTAFIIGHNPELTGAANLLTGKYIENIPTCGIVKINFDSEWKEVKQKSGKLEFFIYPKLFTS